MEAEVPQHTGSVIVGKRSGSQLEINAVVGLDRAVPRHYRALQQRGRRHWEASLRDMGSICFLDNFFYPALPTQFRC